MPEPTKDKNYYKAIKNLRAEGKPITSTNIQKSLSGNLGSESTLKGTMAEEKDLLPTKDMDQLDLLSVAMQDLSQKAAEQGIGKGMETVTGALEESGASLDRMSGDITSRIIDFTQSQVTSPIESEMKQMSTLLEGVRQSRERERKTARDNLSTLINTGAITNMSDEELSEISSVAGIGFDSLKHIKTAVGASNSADNSIQDSILSDISGAIDQYQNSGDKQTFKDNYKEALVQRFGKKYRDFIETQVEARFPTGGGLSTGPVGSDLTEIWDSTVSEGGTLRDFVKKAREEKEMDRTEIRSWLDQTSDHHNFQMGTINEVLDEQFSQKMTASNIKDLINKKIDDYKKQGYKREEAADMLYNTLTSKDIYGVESKDDLPDQIENAVEDKLVDTYGRTFFQKIIPGGR